MVRLNADLIWKSPHFFNATKERELDLRGNKITIIENIGATEDQFDTIDLSDNDIVKLENFPFMNRLGTLLINNNRITHINRNLGEILHKMHTLVLTNNCLTSLAEIDPLASLPKLQFLSLLDNTVTKQPDYRLYVIHKLKHLRLLDFKEVKQQEKTEAAQKFHSKETEETEKRVATKSYTPGQVGDSEGTTKNQGAKVVSPTAAQVTAIKAALVNSQTLHEVPGLEKALSAGQVRAEFAFPKPDTNMAQASEEAKAEKMETDGQDQEDGADEQKETDESTLVQEERSEAGQKFHSKEAEEAAKKVSAKAYSPVVMDTQGTTKNQGPEVVAPTPAQMTAIKAAIMNSQPLDELGLEKEFLGADLDSIYDTLSHIESYMYQNFERAPFNFIVSWRKRFFHGMHILPPPRRQEPDDCAYHATLALMECGFKVMYANRLVGAREFNIKLSHKHLKQLVHDYLTSKEGKGFKPRDLLLVCLRMAMRHGVISEEDYDKGRVREAIRYHILSYTELSADEMRDIPRMLHEDAKMVLTSFRVTPRYRVLLPHEIYRYVPSEDPACQPWTGDKKPSHVSHCVVLTGPGLAYKAPEDCDTEAELSTPERYFEYLNSYSSGYGVDGCGFIFADSIRKCYIVDV